MRIQLRQSMHIYLTKHRTKFHADPSWKNGALGFLEQRCPNKSKNNSMSSNMSSNMGSVPNPDPINKAHSNALAVVSLRVTSIIQKKQSSSEVLLQQTMWHVQLLVYSTKPKRMNLNYSQVYKPHNQVNIMCCQPICHYLATLLRWIKANVSTSDYGTSGQFYTPSLYLSVTKGGEIKGIGLV